MLRWPFRWTRRELRAAVARLVSLSLIRGWCLTKMPAFPFQKAATDFVRLNVSKCVLGCADDKALNGRSETGSETEQVGSGVNGRRRSGARFWNDR